ncbi:MAG: beta-1,6-N-acetylglucosaminyltransferase, partial [Pseudomonadota bacterium]
MEARVGHIILAHRNIHRASAVANFISAQGSPVYVHIDRRIEYEHKLFSGAVHVCSEYECEWGRLGLVLATLAGVRRLLEVSPDLTHIALLSEGCIPLKPVHTLQAYLSSNPDTDFITMAPLFGGDWVQDGLSDER